MIVTDTATAAQPLLEVQDLKTYFFTEDGVEVRTVPIEWAVEDSTVLAFDPVTRRATGRAAGTTRLIARSRDGSVTAGWTVDVASVQLRAAVQRVDITYRETFPIPVQFPNGDPAPAGLRSGEWSSLDPNVASVSEDGVVTGIGWGRTTVVLAYDDAPRDSVVVSVMPSGSYNFSGVLEDATDRASTGVVSGTLHFTPTADGVLATIDNCGSQVITGPGAFSFDCGPTLTFVLTPPFGIEGAAAETVNGTSPGPRRTEIIRECARIDTETGRCVEYRDRRREAASPAITWTTTRSGVLALEKIPQ